MNSCQLISRLEELQESLVRIVLDFGERLYREQFSPELSPVGWHLRHTLFIEDFWLHEKLLADSRYTENCHKDYLPWKSPKPLRGSRLPPFPNLVSEVASRQKDNVALLHRVTSELGEHPLLQNDYLLKFLIQHHAMHAETMAMIQNQRELALAKHDDSAKISALEPAPAQKKAEYFPEGHYVTGGDNSWCFDNELPQQTVFLPAFGINTTTVSNSEFLGFMQAGGYQKKSFWSPQGWQWLAKTQVISPHAWRQTAKNSWGTIDPSGWQALEAEAAVTGISFFEASAFAKYAGARLPVESEWETASRAGALRIGGAWEWCANTFSPYQGYKAFPYDEYSSTWFDGHHYVLKGASPHTAQEIQRPSFRNFYTSEQRHIFAGLRLAFDDWPPP